MRFDKLKKQLELLILLSDSSSYTVNELCEKMDLSRRNFYYLLDFLKQAGFIIFKNEGCYHIDRRSPFFIDLLQAVQFSEAEVKTIYSLLQMIGKDSDTANQLRKKFSHTNKTFKVSRMEDIEELDTSWLHEDKHRQVFTDIFMFSGEERHHVRLRLGLLSRNLFIEEFPQGTKYITPDGDGKWILDIDVCDYRGLGRFVLGLFRDIDIVEGDDFRAYMRKEIDALAEKNV